MEFKDPSLQEGFLLYSTLQLPSHLYIIITINLVLDGEYNSYADMNSDEIVNVLDIIQIVNIILNNQYIFNYHNTIKYIDKWIK